MIRSRSGSRRSFLDLGDLVEQRYDLSLGNSVEQHVSCARSGQRSLAGLDLVNIVDQCCSYA